MTGTSELQRRLNAVGETVRELEDIETIKTLQRRFVDLVARRQWGEIISLFAVDAEVDLRDAGVHVGRGAIGSLFDEVARNSVHPDGYVLSSPVIHVEGDTATGEWTSHRYLCEYGRDRRIRSWGAWFEGRYVCEYVRAGRGWLLSRMWFREVLPDADADLRHPQWWHGAAH